MLIEETVLTAQGRVFSDSPRFCDYNTESDASGDPMQPYFLKMKSFHMYVHACVLIDIDIDT